MFDPFKDFETAGYLRNFEREKDLDIVKVAIMLMPQKHELTTQEAAAFLNVSRPYVIKQIEQGRLRCRKVGRHRRVEFQELLRFQQQQQQHSEEALQGLSDLSQELGLGY